MALRDIDEAEYLSQQAVVRTVNNMLSNKDARKLLLQARKLAEPNAVIPEIDAAAPVQSELAAIRDELAADKAARAEERRQAEEQRRIAEFTAGWNNQKRALREAGWSSDGIQAIERHAEERGIADLEIAAAHYEKLHPPSDVAQPGVFGARNLFDQQPQDDTFVKSLLEFRGDNDALLNAEIGAAIKDFRNQAGTRR